jgi:hypothetical protein
MNRAKRTRARLGVLVVAALGALALLALPGLSAARDRHDDHSRHHGDRHDRGHHHGRHHHQAGDAGTIASFDKSTGRLTIDLSGTETVSGLVTDRTRIKCEDEHSPDVSAPRSHGEAEPGDDNGRDDEPGDDNGGNSGAGSSRSGPSGHDDNGTGANCTASDLIVGAVVHEAELDIEHRGAIFEEVELAE